MQATQVRILLAMARKQYGLLVIRAYIGTQLLRGPRHLTIPQVIDKAGLATCRRLSTWKELMTFRPSINQENPFCPASTVTSPYLSLPPTPLPSERGTSGLLQ